MIVDDMENHDWQALGGGLNMGLCIGRNDVVTVKHGWAGRADEDPSIPSECVGSSMNGDAHADRE